MGKAFAAPRRLELLDLLAQGPRTVDELAQASEQSSANASQHLLAMHAAGIVSRERDGNQVRYSLAGEDVLRLWLALREVSAARLAEVERAAREYLGDDVETIGADELTDPHAPTRRLAGRRPPAGGVRSGAHRRGAVDPARRAPATAG